MTRLAVHKYPLAGVGPGDNAWLPEGAVLLDVGIQVIDIVEQVVVWALVEQGARTVERALLVWPTGPNLPAPPAGREWSHVGTAQTSIGYVVHVFDAGEDPGFWSGR